MASKSDMKTGGACGSGGCLQLIFVLVSTACMIDTVQRRFEQVLELGWNVWQGSGTSGSNSLVDFTVSETSLNYRLTEADRRDFEQKGYLVVKDVLGPTELADLNAAADDWYSQGHLGRKGAMFHGYVFSSTHDWALRRPALVQTLANPRILGKIIDILGWNIKVYHAHLAYKEGVENPECDSVAQCASNDDPKHGVEWHQDSGRINMDLDEAGDPRPRFSVKVGFYLTDTTDSESPAMWVIPGSHLNHTKAVRATALTPPPGAVPLRVPAGSAVIADRRMWHAPPPDRNFRLGRKILFYGFAHRWLQTKDPMQTSEVMKRAKCPVIQQLLGRIGTYNGLYSPNDDDAPLRSWLETRGALQDNKMNWSASLSWDPCTKDHLWGSECL
eukprot:gnl/MRDRNA2_/MRDRNA2_35425_c0_seq1.p1 gnl/MRDRNA2_/MRDRNA2_35425_c0~~gnl/MRDRNA2_/MRDRNA2_35425_c0_seq1.p1  ORF type:complete len:387 (-),score=54.59 gnl/MRDRNA2_/MRDRNA2_35425_c0_seq1:115-1275(-)